MKLIRFGEANKEKPGVIINDVYYDVSAFGEDYNEQFFESDGLSRLQKFVDLAKTVDFNAELKTIDGKKKFVNTAYEYKSYEWKQIYRAGKDVIEPAVTFAEQWIKELN